LALVKPGVDHIRPGHRGREQRRQPLEDRSDAVARERRDLQPLFGNDRLDPGRRWAPARIRVIVHFGDIDRRLASRRVERPSHQERTAGISLDQQDDLAVAQQRRHRPDGIRLVVAPGAQDDDVSTVDRGPQIRRGQLDLREPAVITFDIDAAASASIGEAAVVEVVQSQTATEQPKVCGEINATAAGPDDRYRCLRHVPVPDPVRRNYATASVGQVEEFAPALGADVAGDDLARVWRSKQ